MKVIHDLSPKEMDVLMSIHQVSQDNQPGDVIGARGKLESRTGEHNIKQIVGNFKSLNRIQKEPPISACEAPPVTLGK